MEKEIIKKFKKYFFLGILEADKIETMETVSKKEEFYLHKSP